jgi:hypothetical protein
MQNFLFTLAAIALIGQFNQAVAQMAATQGQRLINFSKQSSDHLL